MTRKSDIANKNFLPLSKNEQEQFLASMKSIGEKFAIPPTLNLPKFDPLINLLKALQEQQLLAQEIINSLEQLSIGEFVSRFSSISPQVVLHIIGLLTNKTDEIVEKQVNARIKLENKTRAKKAAEAKHSKPGGSRDLAAKIKEIYLSGKYSSKDRCAEEEYAALGFNSFRTARNALNGQTKPKLKK